MDPTWESAAAFVSVAAIVPIGTLFAAWLLRRRPKDIPPTRALTYECGEEPTGVAQVRFHARYFVVALLFVLFDVEAAFLLPWAINVRDGSVAMLGEMFVFLGILLLGWAYAVRKGALSWR